MEHSIMLFKAEMYTQVGSSGWMHGWMGFFSGGSRDDTIKSTIIIYKHKGHSAEKNDYKERNDIFILTCFPVPLHLVKFRLE